MYKTHVIMTLRNESFSDDSLIFRIKLPKASDDVSMLISSSGAAPNKITFLGKRPKEWHRMRDQK
jgi:hypothetical protein